ncbi:hypothetical protein [Vulcanisaeta thermophila]|uniref:hypothetical protein n=1 Tax=Vulcanisaeta thermophila TaxID=867917 RepID=UPI000853A370|nr:hypothetical protein [Vulcanisaeta thermophila]
MVDIATVLSIIGSVATVVGPLTALLWDRLNRLEDRLNDRLDRLESRVNNIEGELREIRVDINNLSRSMLSFSNALIDVLAIKNVISQSEVAVLRGYLSLIPMARTKYYTKEDEEKLRYLITVKPYEDYTWDDIRTLREIADHMIKEYRETGREELIDYAYKLLFFTWVAEGHLLAGIIGPNRKRQGQESPGQPCQGR